ncbi:MAG: radical SAM protein [bacterium]|nr:radical SAM protein [bacterium]
MSLSEIRKRVESKTRISRDEIAWLYHNAAMDDLSQLAKVVRERFHLSGEATYLMMAIVNYTNICVAKCDYCSFYRLPGAADGYLLSLDQVSRKIESLIALGGTLVGFNGGFHPDLHIEDYAELFHSIHQRFPQTAFFEMTVAEFLFSCNVSRVSVEEGATILHQAGTRWVTGGGAEVLDDAFRRRHSPSKYSVAEFFRAQKAILAAGMGSTATMVIGFDETLDERLNHLESLRDFQDQTNGALPSFLCWTYKPDNNDLGGEEISTEEYLRWLALSRIYLDNIPNIRTSVLTKNKDALLGLCYGANDFDLPTEDEVTQMAGAVVSHDFDSILATGRELGFALRYREPYPLSSGPYIKDSQNP